MRYIAFGICFGLLVILPVWVMNFVDLSLFYKLMFTVGGAIGVYTALEFGSLRARK